MVPAHPRQRRSVFPLEWLIAEDDTAWAAALGHSSSVEQPRSRRVDPRRRIALLATAMVVFGALSSTAVWGWRQARAGIAGVEQALAETVAVDLWLTDQGQRPATVSRDAGQATDSWAAQMARETTVLQMAQTEAQGTPSAAQVELLGLGQNWALVRMITAPAAGQPSYRQLRVYRETERGWLRSRPTTEQWGASQTLETDYFVFTYQARDVEAVLQAVPRLDALYPLLYSAFHAGAPPRDKIRVEVTPEQRPGVIVLRSGPDMPLLAASPGVYLAPDTVGDAELLAQAVFLSLLDEMAKQARDRSASSADWMALWDAVRLWALWQTDLPLAAARESLVTWIYSPTSDSGGPTLLSPNDGAELCDLYSIWMATPVALGLPVGCVAKPRSVAWLSWHYPGIPPLERFRSLPIGYEPEIQGEWEHVWAAEGRPARAVALATVVEYAAATYDPNRLPTWLDALEQHTSWETLTPALFAVSAAEFEAGWRAHLAERYEIGDGTPDSRGAPLQRQ